MRVSSGKFFRQLSSSQESASVIQFANPDVAETDRISVILEGDGELVGMRLVFGGGVWTHPSGSTAKDGVVLDQDAVVQDGEGGATGDFAIFIE